MKTRGNSRPVDKLGRVCLPKDIREKYNICEKDELDIQAKIDDNGDEILVLKKCAPTCVFCHSSKELQTVGGKPICQRCSGKLRKELSLI